MDEKEQLLLHDLEQGLRVEAARLGGAIAAEVTRAFTQVATGTLERHGYRARTEAPIRHEGGAGFLDIAGYIPGEEPLRVAIELDGEYRRRSVRKLMAATAVGAIGLWVRWGRTFQPWERLLVPKAFRHVEIRVQYGTRTDLRASRGARLGASANVASATAPEQRPEQHAEGSNSAI
jgi:hypothetical protein